MVIPTIDDITKVIIFWPAIPAIKDMYVLHKGINLHTQTEIEEYLLK